MQASIGCPGVHGRISSGKLLFFSADTSRFLFEWPKVWVDLLKYICSTFRQKVEHRMIWANGPMNVWVRNSRCLNQEQCCLNLAPWLPTHGWSSCSVQWGSKAWASTRDLQGHGNLETAWTFFPCQASPTGCSGAPLQPWRTNGECIRRGGKRTSHP